MQKYQVGFILGIGIICAAGIPLLLPRASILGSALPDPLIQSVVIALAGLIVLVISILVMFKSTPTSRK